MPTDLCHAYTSIFFGPMGRSSAMLARITWMMISMTISQCRNWAMWPQRVGVFRMLMETDLTCESKADTCF